MVLLEREDSADRVTDQYTDAVGIMVADFHPRLARRLLRRGNRVLDKEIHLFDIPPFDPVFGVEITHLARDADGKVGDVKAGDRADTRAPRDQCLPVFLKPRPQRRYQPSAGHHYASINVASHLSSLPFYR